VGDVSSDFARAIVAIERGDQDVLKVGNLEAVRDFLDVKDGVRALWLLAERGEPGQVYNLCSGVGHPVRRILEIFVSLATRAIPVEHDLSRTRPFDEPIIVGDNSRLRALGWAPSVPVERSLVTILNYWRSVATL
jgi:GDP-4-dehydro-6-deoxy-D-mannose reductase